jgi:hypothetical protein
VSETSFPNRATQFQPGNPGRPAGSLVGREHRKRLRRAAAQAEAVRDIAPAFHGDALALFQRIYRDEMQPLELRLVAARAAASFERPTLAATAVAVTTKEDEARQELAKAPPSVRLAHLQSLAAQIGLAVSGRLPGAEHEPKLLDGKAIEVQQPPKPDETQPPVEPLAAPSAGLSASQELQDRITAVEKLTHGIHDIEQRSRLARLRAALGT